MPAMKSRVVKGAERKMRRISMWLLVLLTSCLNGPIAGAADLHLRNAGNVPGELTQSDQPNVVRLQAKSFVTPFLFPLSGVSAIHFPVPAELPKPSGDYCFELSGGDILYGSLLGLNEKEAELEVSRAGRIHVERSAVNRIYRWRSSADL